MLQKINYNSISPEYNKRYEAGSHPGIKEKLLNIARPQNPGSILEIACGTGHWLNVLSSLDCKLFGLDLSLGMLKEAKNLYKGFNLVNADSAFIPFKPQQFDMIICVNAVHFFCSQRQFISNCIELLKPDGLFNITGFDPLHTGTEWYVYKYFEGTLETDKKRYPRFEELKNAMLKSGFKNVELELIENVHTSKLNEEVLLDPFIMHKGCSQLAALSKEEYEIGINKIKEKLELHKNEKLDISFITNLYFYSLTASKL